MNSNRLNLTRNAAQAASLIGALLFILCGLSYAAEGASIFASLQAKFPDSVKVVATPKAGSFEFCPDNTCDLLKAKKAISSDAVSDIGYLYVYYFSDYLELEDWRKSKQANLIASGILNKPEYTTCSNNADMKKRAYCVLQTAMKNYNITLYSVRFDENKRNLERVSLPKH